MNVCGRDGLAKKLLVSTSSKAVRFPYLDLANMMRRRHMNSDVYARRFMGSMKCAVVYLNGLVLLMKSRCMVIFVMKRNDSGEDEVCGHRRVMNT